MYPPEDLKLIIERSAEILNVEIDPEGALEIASRSRGTPRIVNRLLKRVRDYAQVRGNGIIDLETARAALEMLAIDEIGLDAVDRRMLSAMVEKFGGAARWGLIPLPLRQARTLRPSRMFTSRICCSSV